MEEKKLKINLGSFSLVKGLAMIVIVVTHMLGRYDQTAMKVLYPLTAVCKALDYAIMPMFFIISGFSFRKKTAKVMLKKSAGELLVPYLLVTAFVAALLPVVHYLCFRWWPGAIQEGSRYTLAYLLGIAKSGKSVGGISMYECEVVWFLLAMFWAFQVLNLVLKLKNELAQALLITLGVIAGLILFQLDFTWFCIPQGLLGAGYCYLGYEIKVHNVLNKRRWMGPACILLAAAYILEVAFGEFRLSYGVFKYGLPDCVGAGCGGLLLFMAGAYFGQTEWRGLDWIRQTGIYSYWIMCIHSVEMAVIPWYLWSTAMADHPLLAFFAEALIKAVVFTVVCLALKKISQYRFRRKRKVSVEV